MDRSAHHFPCLVRKNRTTEIAVFRRKYYKTDIADQEQFFCRGAVPFVRTYYMLTLTNDLQIISQGAYVGLQLKPLQFVTILRCWLKMNMEAVDAVESVFSKL